jgi:hypothetical protein
MPGAGHPQPAPPDRTAYSVGSWSGGHLCPAPSSPRRTAASPVRSARRHQVLSHRPADPPEPRAWLQARKTGARLSSRPRAVERLAPARQKVAPYLPFTGAQPEFFGASATNRRPTRSWRLARTLSASGWSPQHIGVQAEAAAARRSQHTERQGGVPGGGGAVDAHRLARVAGAAARAWLALVRRALGQTRLLVAGHYRGLACRPVVHAGRSRRMH